MKITNFHPSFALGLGAGLAVFGLLSLAPGAGSGKTAVYVSLDPDPATIVRVYEGAPYTVPPGGIFVVKALGDVTGSSLSSMRLLVDGLPAAGVQLGSFSGDGALNFPVAVPAGSTVAVEQAFSDPNTTGFATGYLVRN